MPINESTIARMAGNMIPGLIAADQEGSQIRSDQQLARDAVALARMITAEVARTEPAAPQPFSGPRPGSNGRGV